MKLQVDDAAPDFTLSDQDNTEHTLSLYHGTWVLLYFYPKDDTPGCTTEACSVRDNLPHFEASQAVVLGISADTAQSHKKFAEKFELPFPLLADTDHAVCTAYGVWGEKMLFGRNIFGIQRTSFLIDPQGKIAKIYPKVDPEEHADDVLNDLKHLAS